MLRKQLAIFNPMMGLSWCGSTQFCALIQFCAPRKLGCQFSILSHSLMSSVTGVHVEEDVVSVPCCCESFLSKS